jgi:LPXTG-motif cell wall-anchored protein
MSLKKTFAALGAVVLSIGALALVSAAPASATSNAITITPSAIKNGQHITVNFGSWAGVLPTPSQAPNQASELNVLCLYRDNFRQENNEPWMYNAGNTVPATRTVAAGSLDDALNWNGTGQTTTYKYAVIHMAWVGMIATPQCNDMDEDFANATSFTQGGTVTTTVAATYSWTVGPAMQSPINHTMYVGQSSTAAVQYTNSYASTLVDPSSNGSSWSALSTNFRCTGGNDTMDTLPSSVTLDTTSSAAGVMAPLKFLGTPTAADARTYHLCLALEGNHTVYTLANVTIAAAPAPLPNTGSDHSGISLLGAGAGMAVIAGIAIMMIRRRRTN